jgi:hypothetical protein
VVSGSRFVVLIVEIVVEAAWAVPGLRLVRGLKNGGVVVGSNGMRVIGRQVRCAEAVRMDGGQLLGSEVRRRRGCVAGAVPE